MMSAFTAAGFGVFVITGVEATAVTKADVAAKREYLTGLGISSDLYRSLIVCPQPHPQNKLKAIEENDIEVLLDNSKANCRAAQGKAMCLLLWNARVKS